MPPKKKIDAGQFGLLEARVSTARYYGSRYDPVGVHTLLTGQKPESLPQQNPESIHA
jgi:hypothetical protein